MTLLTRLRELSDSNYDIYPVTIENRELKALLDVVEAAKEFTEDRKGKTGMIMGGRSIFFADKMRIALSALDGEAK